MAISIHEYAHARMAYKLGDDTAARAGRMTIEPWAHLDPIGALMLLVFGFGWARPVPVDPYRLRNPRKDMAKVAVSGPVANLIAAFVLETSTVLVFSRLRLIGTPWTYLTDVLRSGAMINAALAFFNLIPLPPLDGSKILRVYLPYSLEEVWDFIERYGFVILMGLVYLGVVGAIIQPLIQMYMAAVFRVAVRLSLLLFPV
ncbi:MAG: site-2 protease family protein [Bacillota bacterium]